MSQPSTGAFEAEVVRLEELGPSFRRVTLGGEGMADFGIFHHPRDQRFKLIIPPRGGDPTFDVPGFIAEQQHEGTSWYQAWLQLDPELRGIMRTYTVREWRDAARELVVDMVLHTDEHGHSGPAARWAERARIGSRIQLIGPSRHGEPSTAAIDFHPGGARHLLLAGDETAVPAIASILDHLDGRGVSGHALLEVPTEQDVQSIPSADGPRVTWLPRDGAALGTRLDAAMRDVLSSDDELRAAAHSPRPADHGSADGGTDADGAPFYAWLAAESGVVKGLRRHLVRDLGIDRARVAFSGYWKLGTAEGA